MLCIIHCGFLWRRTLRERGIYTCSMPGVNVLWEILRSSLEDSAWVVIFLEFRRYTAWEWRRQSSLSVRLEIRLFLLLGWGVWGCKYTYTFSKDGSRFWKRILSFFIENLNCVQTLANLLSQVYTSIQRWRITPSTHSSRRVGPNCSTLLTWPISTSTPLLYVIIPVMANDSYLIAWA
jgi:hypothetical protein